MLISTRHTKASVLLQFLFSPAFVALFFASLLTLEGRPKDIVPKLKQVSHEL
jgi:hypothetical protein